MTDAPLLLKPAPADISPVAFSSTDILSIRLFGAVPSSILDSTVLKIQAFDVINSFIC